MKEPRTLQDAIKFFAEPDNCLGYLMARRWPDGIQCPTCGSGDVRFISTRRMWECKNDHARKQFTIKVGTIMEDSAIGLDKWLVAMWLVANCKNGISSYELARTIGVTQKSAWFLLHRIRLAMKTTPDGTKIGSNGGGEVEADETFIGGLAKNMHKERRQRYQKQGGKGSKTAVMGVLDRETRQIRAKVVPDVKRETLQKEILNNVKYGSRMYTDSAVVYDKLKWRYIHEVVNHAEKYVNGRVHTNGLENFWSLLKRTLHGTYVAVEPFHLERYVDEQVFRYNNRKNMTDFDRFSVVSANLGNKRLTYAEVTGKVGTTPF